MISETTRKKIRESGKLRFLILLVTIAIIVLMFPKGESIESEVNVGSIWIKEDLIAQFTFEVLKTPENYAREQAEAAAGIKPVFVYQPEASTNALDSISKYRGEFYDLVDGISNLESDISSFGTFLSPKSFQILWRIRKDEFKLLKQYKKSLNEVFNISQDALTRIYRRGVLSISYDDIDKDSIAVREGKFEREYLKTKYYDINTYELEIERYVRSEFSSNPSIVSAVTEFASHFVISNLVYSEALTNEVRQAARIKVSPNTDIVNENELIVAKHSRITQDVKNKIDSYKTAKGEVTGFWTKFWQTLGKVLHIVLVLSLFSIYIFLFRKKIYHNNFKILLIALVILFVSSQTFLVEQINVDAPVHLLIFVPVASILLTIIFDSRIGFYGTVITALIVAGLRGNDYVFAVMHIVAGALAAYTVRDIKNRNQIFVSFVFILLGYLMCIIAFGLESFAKWDQMLLDGAFVAFNALISPILAYGLIIFIERAFKVTTDLTLLELTDFNTPILKELAKKAPGTFTHSMTIGSMVESAAEDIKANPLLARVGAYYHDIGKTLDPDTFVENQLNSENIHESLKPDKSAELIVNHVKKGIELAAENKLPSVVADFIPMHHGTMVVSYFYEKAKELFGEENVDRNNFRYPGPKPNTKETALVMLADACESTVRSMVNPEPQKV